jgi:predicted nucleic acid-binding protein
MMFLVDTNVFLEVLLRQDKKEDCKRFLENNIRNLNMIESGYNG